MVGERLLRHAKLVAQSPHILAQGENAVEALIWLFFIAVIVFTPFAFYDGAKRKSKHKEMERQIESLPTFSPVLSFVQADMALGLFLDPDSCQFAVAGPKKTPRLYGFDQLVAVDVLRDGSSLQKTNRGSQAVGAAVGGVLLGPVGLLLGGLTGSKRSEERVRRLSLKLFTDDLHTPITEVVFFDFPQGVTPDSDLIKLSAQALDEWHGRFRTILQRNQQPATPTPPQPVPPVQPANFGRRRGLIVER